MQKRQGAATKRELTFIDLSLSVRYKTVLFPFETVELLRVLPREGYVVSPEVPTVPPFRGRVEIGGKVATKGEASLVMDERRGVLSIQCLNPDVAADEFERLEVFLQEALGFRSEPSAFFYELLSDMTIAAEGSPADSLTRHLQAPIFLHKMESLLGRPLVNFAFRLGPKDVIPADSAEWVDILIEPAIKDWKRRFMIAVVFRKQERQAVLEFARNLPNTMIEMINALEDRG